MSRGPRARRRVPRWLGNPFASAVIVSLLALDQYWLVHRGPATRTTVQALVVDPPAAFAASPARDLYILRTGAELHLIDTESESWDRLAAAVGGNEPGRAVLRVQFVKATTPSGFWSHTSERSIRWFTLSALTGTWTPEDLDDARAMLHAESRAVPDWHWLARNRDVIDAAEVKSRILWGGVAHSVLAALLACCLVLSLLGWPAWLAYKPWSRRARRLRRGACPECGYDLRGIETGRCPECGRDAPSPRDDRTDAPKRKRESTRDAQTTGP